MKRWFALLLVVAGLVPFARAAKKVTAAQFEQAVAALRAKPDAEAAFLVADMHLTERLSAARIDRIKALLVGEKSRQALVAVADASEFELPPAEEIPAAASPDVAGQRRIMGQVANYISTTIPHLPNFVATRTTDFFEDTPLLHMPNGSIHYEPLHLVARSSAAMLFRDGHEVEERSKRTREAERGRGLHSYGEFGPILALVLVDAAQNKLAFSRWGQETRGLEAVFRYQVPKEKSHYSVDYCCVANEAGSVVANESPFHEIAGYHGDMAVDPETGAILRITVFAELKNGSPVTRANLLVDYAPVEIGGKTYVCPIKGVSITTAEMVQHAPGGYPLARQLQPLKTMLNEVRFDDYHVFRSEARVLTAESHDSAAPPAQASPQDPPSTPPAETNSAAPPAGQKTGTSPTGEAPALAPIPSAETPSITPPSSAAVTPQLTFSDAVAIPDLPAQPLSAALNTGYRLRTTTRLVDVGLVAYDKKGRPVTDLKQSDFEIYDNGRRQEIKYFGQATQAESSVASPASPAAPAKAEEIFYANRQTPLLQPRTAPSGSHATILMIDSSSIAWADLQYARQEMLRFLKGLPDGEPVGLYILRSYGFQILLEPTADHAQVANALTRWMPDALDLARAQREEERHREHFDTVHSLNDLTAVNGNESPDPSTYSSGQGVANALAHPADPKLRALGSNPEADALTNLLNVGRHLAALPGHKSLVWVASDNVLADWNNEATAKPDEKGMAFLHSAAVHVQEALNEAHVSLYPLDASQLEPGGVGADIGRVNIVPFDASDRDQRLAALGDVAPANKPGRVTAQMKQDTHPIQPEFRELAEATGGRALRRAGDIAAELNGIAEDGRAAYQLSFTPDAPADDKYHLITVKLTGRRDLKLRYRTGYLYEKEPATLKERFRQAVWQPRDVTDIAVTAASFSAASPATLKLNIAATDLEMAQAGDRWADKLDIFLIERDDAASHAKVHGRSLAMNLMPATYQNVLHYGIDVDQPLPAKSDVGSFRIVVVDENSGRMGSVTIPAAR